MKHCPTDEMIGDFFTKPLGGAKFRRFCNIIMNCSHDDYGPVDVDALIAAHHRRIDQDGRTDDDTNEPKDPRVTCHWTPGSQEHVGIRTNGMWAAIRMAHKKQKTRRHTNTRGQKTHRHTKTHGGYRQHIGAAAMRTRKAIAAE